MGRKRRFSGQFGGVLRGFDLVWESATPPTHIWKKKLSQRKRFYFWGVPLKRNMKLNLNIQKIFFICCWLHYCRCRLEFIYFLYFTNIQQFLPLLPSNFLIVGFLSFVEKICYATRPRFAKPCDQVRSDHLPAKNTENHYIIDALAKSTHSDNTDI